jgi:hypothetical protein
MKILYQRSRKTKYSMGWRCDSRGRVSILQVQSPEFKLQSHKNNTPPRGYLMNMTLLKYALMRRTLTARREISGPI